MTTLPWAILWDVDGTLVDTAELHFQAWQTLARAIDKPFTRDDFAGTFGWRNPEIIPKLFGKHYDADEIAALGDRKEDIYRQEAAKGVALLPGALELLASARAAGARQAIGSSAPRRNIEMIVRDSQIALFFHAIIAMEDTPRGKPDPAVFLMGAQRLGIPTDRCIVLEDAPVGVLAAKSAGMRAVGVTFVGHHSAEKLHDAGADLVVPNLEAVDTGKLLGLLAS